MQGDAFIYGRLAALILALSLAVGCGAGKGVRADPVSPNSPLPSAATPVSPTATPPTVPPPTVPPPTPTPVTPVATAPVATGVTSSIAGKIVVIDPGHAGGNVAHARDIAAGVPG